MIENSEADTSPVHEHVAARPGTSWCTDFTGEAPRLGGFIRYTAHLCLSGSLHDLEGNVRQAVITVDRPCSSPVVQEALADPEVFERLREDLARLAVQQHLLRSQAKVSWRGRPLD